MFWRVVWRPWLIPTSYLVWAAQCFQLVHVSQLSKPTLDAPGGRRHLRAHTSATVPSENQLSSIYVHKHPLPSPISRCVLLSRFVYSGQSARKNALQVIAEYEGTPAAAVEVPDLSALRELYSEKNPAVPSLRYPLQRALMWFFIP